MRSIRRKKDIVELMEGYKKIFEFDAVGSKYYFILPDLNRGGIWTLMKNADSTWSLHGRDPVHNKYNDEAEIYLDEDEVMMFIWKNRKAVNQSLKELV